MTSPRDRSLLERAVALGRQGWGRVHPNPMVGCLIVRDGVIVAEGWHAEFGGPHAEVAALAAAGASARGAELFVSLEPCRHRGKTGPCTEALLAAGVTRVIFGAADPGAESGGGAQLLREAGIEVIGPVLTSEESRRENPVFFHTDPRRPWVALKLALSLDGGIAGAEGVRTALSGDAALEEVQRLRAGFDAILVGTETARIDDPLLTVRGPVMPRVRPRPVLLDARGQIGPKARVFQGGGEPWLLTTEASTGSWRDEVRGAGGEPVVVAETPEGRIDLQAALLALRSRGIRSLLCEGGGILGGSLLAAGAVDRLHLVLTPTFLGSRAVRAFPEGIGVGIGPSRAGGPAAWRFTEEPRRLGDDLWMTLEPVATTQEG